MFLLCTLYYISTLLRRFSPLPSHQNTTTARILCMSDKVSQHLYLQYILDKK
ncbi:hypothetical protein C0J52_11273 [Blattella germanica]|nr:hypothetical protein C0J52_11273 [Blattella germanica]